MIHHQHYFPVVDEEGKLKPAFLAVTNMEAEKPEIIARNSERVLTARLRDARFFYDEDRKATLESRIDRLATILFHKKLGTYREKADRVAALASWIASEALGQPAAAAHAQRAGLLCKADLATDMVRELTELQGTMGGIYAREEGLPEQVWKAIYFHYLPIGVEADAPPTRQQLGSSAITWAAVSLADKIDSVVGMFTAGERPTGSRDPLGLRRQAQGAVKILADLPELTGLDARVKLGTLLSKAAIPFGGLGESSAPLASFIADRLAYLLNERGFDVRSVRAVMHSGIEDTSPLDARRKLEALTQMMGSAALLGVATLLKRVKNISKGVATPAALPSADGQLTEPAEKALAAAIAAGAPTIRAAADRGDYREAFAGVASLQPAVARFFDDVLVMAEDERVRAARLGLVASLRGLILDIADISEMASE
jgi:glycyl-tRNA synthetase beta chain